MRHDVVEDARENSAVDDSVPALMLFFESHPACRAMVDAVVIERKMQSDRIRMAAYETSVVSERDDVTVFGNLSLICHRLHIIPCLA